MLGRLARGARGLGQDLAQDVRLGEALGAYLERLRGARGAARRERKRRGEQCRARRRK
jgi:hypothetical protein